MYLQKFKEKKKISNHIISQAALKATQKPSNARNCNAFNNAFQQAFDSRWMSVKLICYVKAITVFFIN